MKISQKGIDLIKEFEGFSAKMYKDAVGLPTIGYGTLIDTKEENYLKTKIITKQEAEQLLRKDVEIFESSVNKMITSKINQNQYDAIVCFVYNLGANNFRKSTLLKKININPNDKTIRDEFMKWNKAGGMILKGLTRRRKAEADLYFY